MADMKSPSYCLVACLALSIVYALPLFGVPQKTKKETVWRTICLDGIDCSYQVAIFRTPSQTEVRNWVDKVAPPPHKKIKGLVRIASSQYLSSPVGGIPVRVLDFRHREFVGRMGRNSGFR